MTEPIHIISLGAGVQSSTMALMAAHGEITPMPVAAIFADTKAEPASVYRWLDWLEKQLPFPVYRVMRSSLADNLCQWGHSQIPSFTVGKKGEACLGKRQCTKHWKIVPVQKECRRITGTTRKRIPSGSFVVWNGISTDEAHRQKDSRAHWIRNRCPLLEKRMSRVACLEWMKARGFPEPPKSACVFCPFQGPKQWRAHKADHEAWGMILRVDAQLEARGEFLTSELKRIGECDFSTDADSGQGLLWGNECEGMCGV